MFPSFQIENLLLCASYIIFGIMIGLFLNHNRMSWIRLLLVWVVYYLLSYLLHPLLPSIFAVSNGMITLFTLFNPLLFLTICLIGITNFTNPKQQELFRYLYSLKAQIKERLSNKEITIEEMKLDYIKALSLNISLSDILKKDLNEEKRQFINGITEVEKTLLGVSKLFYRK